MAKSKKGGKETPKKKKTTSPKKPVKKAAAKKTSKVKKPAVTIAKTPAPKKAARKTIPSAAGLTRGGTVLEESTTLDDLYIVNDSGVMVTLEVNTGAEGQTSDMTIKLDDTIIIANHPGDFEKTPLGTNSELNGKKLSIVATIADTSRDTNLTSVAIHLRGGFKAADFLLSKSVEEEGSSVDYLALIEFFNPSR